MPKRGGAVSISGNGRGGQRSGMSPTAMAFTQASPAPIPPRIAPMTVRVATCANVSIRAVYHEVAAGVGRRCAARPCPAEGPGRADTAHAPGSVQGRI
jgi:hypothetical protein